MLLSVRVCAFACRGDYSRALHNFNWAAIYQMSSVRANKRTHGRTRRIQWAHTHTNTGSALRRQRKRAQPL